MVFCTLCNTSFKNRNSLRVHKSRFHKQNDGSIDEFQDKTVEAREDDSSTEVLSNRENPHPAFGYDASKFAQEGERKRFRSDDEISDESNRSDFKRAKHIDNVQDNKESVEQNFDFEKINKMDRRLKIVEQQIIDPKLMKYVVRLPKMVKILVANLEDIKELEYNIEDLEKYNKRSETLRQIGSGEDEKKIKEFSKDIKQLFDDVNEMKEYIRNQKHTFMEGIEKLLHNCLLMKNLFENNKFDDLRFKTKELCNAAFMLSKGILERKLTKEEQELVEQLSKASQFQARDLLDENYSILKSIFVDMPDYDETRTAVEELRQEYSNEDKDYNPMVEKEQNMEKEYSGAEETSDEEWNIGRESENDGDIDTEETTDEE